MHACVCVSGVCGVRGITWTPRVMWCVCARELCEGNNMDPRCGVCVCVCVCVQSPLSQGFQGDLQCVCVCVLA